MGKLISKEDILIGLKFKQEQGSIIYEVVELSRAAEYCFIFWPGNNLGGCYKAPLIV